MAEVRLVDIKKIYPNQGGTKKKKGEAPEKKHNLQITEEGVVAVQQFSLDIADREFIVLVGPSGCGKTSLLRLILGEDVPHAGTIERGGGLTISYVPQDTSALRGSLTDFARRAQARRRVYVRRSFEGCDMDRCCRRGEPADHEMERCSGAYERTGADGIYDLCP